MKFLLSMTAKSVPNEHAELYKTLGFKFYTEQWSIDDNPFESVLDSKVSPTIEIKNLKELDEFLQKWGECVIRSYGGNTYIEIYNESRE